jgi:uncharacterized RDD family membrane protein YckC
LSAGSEREWDQLSIETPELVAIDMYVAGIGSRFVALLVDYLIWLATLLTLIFLISLLDPSLSHFARLGRKWATALFILIPFLMYWGYFTLFEAFWNGRTPGKRVVKIRVIQCSGRGIGLFESMTRNFLRIVDQFPLVYAVGVISILLTRQNQRLGDLAAGTLVVHERENLPESSAVAGARILTAGVFEPQGPQEQRIGSLVLSPESIRRLEIADLEVLEGFLARRFDFSLETRAELANRIAEAICSKTGMALPAEMNTETVLEETARQLRDLVHMR